MNTTLNIIHLPRRLDREVLFLNELKNQGITDYKVWEGIEDAQIPFRGISKAHKQIVRYAKRQAFENIIIAEDDLKFTAPGAWQYFLDNIPTDYDLFLGSIYFGHIYPDNVVEDYAGNTIYSVHERYYDTFLASNEINHLDREHARKGRFIVCNPFVAIQYETFSDNSKSNPDYRQHMAGRKMFGV